VGRRTLASAIKSLREERELTQRELARRAGLTNAYIVMLEKGTRANPSLDVLTRLAAALGVSVSILVERGRK
jgi:transcriptional regulator with XRE-family HTH domain